MAQVTQTTTVVATSILEWDHLKTLVAAVVPPEGVTLTVALDEGQLIATLEIAAADYVLPPS